ncbi:hypothetical protein [Neptunicella sp. SCSIO 80796]|uniref:hypothetical protein n=1 Tax=Neptunicella plasticusilytica TaxID=3117012 RepID=UPI003A4E393D
MKVNLTAGQAVPIPVVARYFRVMTAVDMVHVDIVSTSGNSYFSSEVTSGIGLDFSDKVDFPEPVGKITIRSETDQQIDIFAELAKVDDDRLSGNFDINAALSVAQTAAKSHNVPALQNIAVSTEVLPVRATRKSALIQTNGQVYIGSTDGVKMSGLFGWDNQSALTLIPVGGIVEVRINEDYD